MIKSYAKVNLGLKVLGRRPDGFHDICSIFQEVDLADTLRIDPNLDGRILSRALTEMFLMEKKTSPTRPL